MLIQMLSGKHSKTSVGSLRTLGEFEDNHLWHSAFPWDTILNNWPYFWAEWIKLNFCSVGTKLIPSHFSSELAILALNSLSYLCRNNSGSYWSLSSLGWKCEESSVWHSDPMLTSLSIRLLCFPLSLKVCSLNMVVKSTLWYNAILRVFVEYCVKCWGGGGR